MRNSGIFSYGMRMVWHRGAWIPPLVVAAYVLFRYQGALTGDWLPLFEVFLPFFSVVYVVPVMVGDKEAGIWPLILSYPVDRTLLFVSKMLPALVMALLLPWFAWGVIRVLGVSLAMETLLYTLPGLLFLTGLSAIASVAAPHAAAAYLFPLGWWALDLSTRGLITRTFYLFAASYPQQGIDMGATKWMLSTAGILLWCGAAACFHRIRP